MFIFIKDIIIIIIIKNKFKKNLNIKAFLTDYNIKY